MMHHLVLHTPVSIEGVVTQFHGFLDFFITADTLLLLISLGCKKTVVV